MKFHEREFFIDRILSGKIRIKLEGESYVFIWPDSDTKYEASEFCSEVLSNSGCLTDEDVLKFLISINYWTEEEEYLLNSGLPKDLENFKVYMYENYRNTSLVEHYKKLISAATTEHTRLYNKRHIYDYLTIEGLAKFSKQVFILERCTKPAPTDLNNLLQEFNKLIIPEDDIREIAKTEPWRSIWNCNQKAATLFPSSLTEEQRRLVFWSLLYDNIYENADLPDEIIEDNDLIDGFMIKRRRDREVEQNNKLLESSTLNGINPNAGEIFIPAYDAKDIKRIDDLNDQNSKIIKQSRLNAIKKHGEINEAQLPDVQRELQMRKNAARR